MTLRFKDFSAILGDLFEAFKVFCSSHSHYLFAQLSSSRLFFLYKSESRLHKCLLNVSNI